MALKNLVSNTFTGNETLEVGQSNPVAGYGGEGFFATIAQLVNCTKCLALTNAATGTIAWPSGAGPAGNLFSTIIFLVASTSATFNLPATPFDGQICELVNGSGGAFTQMTIATTDGAVIVGTTTLGALAVGGSAEFRYVLSTNTWYRIR